MSTEVTVGGRRYRIGTLNAIQQFHVVRRLAPILAALGVGIENIKKLATRPLEEIIPALAPMAHVLAKMTDAEIDYITATCLGVVTRLQDHDGKSWAPVSSGAGLMFEDIDMKQMVSLVMAVLKENTSDFLQGPAAPTQSPRS